jgi:hypothetical protein
MTDTGPLSRGPSHSSRRGQSAAPPWILAAPTGSGAALRSAHGVRGKQTFVDMGLGVVWCAIVTENA